MTLDAAALWFLAGLGLVFFEFLTPGLIVIFIGLGAWVTAAAAHFGWASTLAAQTGIFAGASLILLLGLRRWCQEWFRGLSKNGNASATEEEFLGREARVVAAILPPHPGKVEFKGVPWTARSNDALQPGDLAIITERDGLNLTVRPR